MSTKDALELILGAWRAWGLERKAGQSWGPLVPPRETMSWGKALPPLGKDRPAPQPLWAHGDYPVVPNKQSPGKTIPPR